MMGDMDDMKSQRNFRRGLIGVVLLVTIVGTSGVGVAQTASSPGMNGMVSTNLEDVSDDLGQQAISTDTGAQVEDVGEEAEEEEEGGTVLGEWWGLGGETEETPYIGLVELGVVLLALGLGGYMLAKRISIVPAHYRRYLLPAHEWSMLLGTALTAPHFFAVEEWNGYGFAVGVLLGIEVISGLYGRHLHRHVIRLGRGDESPSIFGNFLALSKEAMFSRWRWIHRSLTVVTAVVLILHIVTAIGE